MKTLATVAASLMVTASLAAVVAQEAETSSQSPVTTPDTTGASPTTSPLGDEAPSTPAKQRAAGEPVPLNPEETVLLDAKRKMVIVNSEVVLREGMLEMLLCKKHTKEHESILAFDGKAYIVHAGLVALGIDPGSPVNFQPEYHPPTGPKLKIELVWKDESGKERRCDSREWIRYSINRYFGEPMEKLPADMKLADDDELRYDATNKELAWYGPMTEAERDKYLALTDDETFQRAIRSFFKKTRERQMDVDWVFAGSMFVRDEVDGHQIYLAESGDVICVANFPSAMIDVDARSSAEGQENLLFEAWTKRVPPMGTKVRIEISLADEQPDEQPEGESADATGADATETEK